MIHLTGVEKTRAAWEGGLSRYLQPGDWVDEAIYQHFLNVLPPIQRPGLIALGEPYSHNDEGKATFLTLRRHRQRWVYVGALSVEQALTVEIGWGEEGLCRFVEELIPKLSEGALPDVISDTGGAGLCHEYSRELQVWIGGEILWLDLLLRRTAFPAGGRDGSCIPAGYYLDEELLKLCRDHAVLLIDGLVVDLTARQYNDELPFPYIWPLRRR